MPFISSSARQAAFRSGAFTLDKGVAASKGLKLWWPLGIQGGEAPDRDYSGFGTHGTRVLSPTRTVSRIREWGSQPVMEFDGSTDAVVANESPGYLLPPPFTISQWFYSRSTSIKTIFSHDSDSNNGYRITSGTTIVFTLGGVANYDFTTLTVSQDAWHHLSVSMDANNGTVTCILDGKSEAIGVGTIGTTPTQIQVGGLGLWAGTVDWDGFIKDVRGYDRVLNASQVRDIYQRPWSIVKPTTSRFFFKAPVVQTQTGGYIRLDSVSARQAAFRSGNFRLDKSSSQAKGLVGFWPLGVQGGDAPDRDYSGYAGHAARQNTIPRSTSKINQWGSVNTLDFDGVSDYTEVPSSDAMNIEVALTVSLWINRDAAEDTYFLGRELSGRGYAFGRESGDDDLRLTIHGRAHLNSTAGMGGSTGEWMHVAVTFSSVQTVFYLDGEQLGDPVAFTDPIFDTLTPMFIGANNNNSTAELPYNGKMKDVRIYDRTLPASAIRDIYQRPYKLVRPLNRIVAASFLSGISADLTGTITATIDEDNKSGSSQTIILTMVGDTWIA